jgi:hypothetical protein
MDLDALLLEPQNEKNRKSLFRKNSEVKEKPFDDSNSLLQLESFKSCDDMEAINKMMNLNKSSNKSGE